MIIFGTHEQQFITNNL